MEEVCESQNNGWWPVMVRHHLHYDVHGHFEYDHHAKGAGDDDIP